MIFCFILLMWVWPRPHLNCLGYIFDQKKSATLIISFSWAISVGYLFSYFRGGYTFPSHIERMDNNRLTNLIISFSPIHSKDTSKLTGRLDEMERSLFRAGQHSLNVYQQWETRKMNKMAASEMVANHRKRKRAVLEDGEWSMNFIYGTRKRKL